MKRTWQCGKVYGETDGAVVIQSTYEKLKEQLNPDYYTKNGIKVIDPEKMTREAGGQMSFMRECYYLGEVNYIGPCEKPIKCLKSLDFFM